MGAIVLVYWNIFLLLLNFFSPQSQDEEIFERESVCQTHSRESSSLAVVPLVSFALNCLSILEQVVYKLIYKLFINFSINLFSLASYAFRTIPSNLGVLIVA